MVENVIPYGKYTYNASAKTITLLGEYATITAEQIKSIRNLSIKAQYFDSHELYIRTLTMTGAVISGIPGDTAAQNTDKLQIVIDSSSSSVPILDTLVTVFNAQSFAKSPDSGYTATATPIDVTICKKLSIACSNSGSTSLSIVIVGKNTSAGTMNIPLYSLVLNTTTTSGGCIITDLPPYVEITVKNLDTINAGTVTITAQKFR